MVLEFHVNAYIPSTEDGAESLINFLCQRETYLVQLENGEHVVEGEVQGTKL